MNECETCNGEGVVEIGPDCTWACDLCGGCYTDILCPLCGDDEEGFEPPEETR